MSFTINSLKNSALYLSIGVVCSYSLSQSSLDQHIPFILLLLGLVIFLAQFQNTFVSDFQDDHLAWRIAHKAPLLMLVLTKYRNSFYRIIVPLTLTYTVLLLPWFSLSQTPLYGLSFGLTLLNLSGWCLLLTLAQGKSTTLLTVFLIPLAIPPLLITQSLFSAIALHNEAGYYLAMHGGLALVSLAVSALLAPIVIRTLSW